MNTYGDLDDVQNLVTQIVARDVATGIELARQIGHKMPANFDVGVRFIGEGRTTRIRIRMNEVTHDSIVQLPHFQMSLMKADLMWREAWVRIHGDALTIAQVWLDRHPEAKVSGDDARLALAILDALEADDAMMEKMIAQCKKTANAFTYATARRPDRML